MVDPAHRARLLRERFFNRVDCVAVLAPWGKPCPVAVDGAEHPDALVAAHLDAAAPPVAVRYRSPTTSESTGRFRVGSYCLAPDGTTRWFCLDFDGAGHKDALADPWGAAIAAFDAFAQVGLPTYLERSGGGGGWHLWCFFETPIAAATARKLGHLLAPIVPLEDGTPSDAKAGRGIEVFPKQDAIRGDELGNMVWLPWWHGAAEGGNLFCHRDGTPYEPDSSATVSAETASQVLASLEPPRVQAPRVHAPPVPGRSAGGLDAIRAAALADPVRVAEALGLIRVGRRYLCPVCQPAPTVHAALRINDSGFYCHKCPANRDAIALVQAVEGVDFRGAVARLADLFGIRLETSPRGRPSSTPARVRPASAPRTPPAPPELYEAFCGACRDLPAPVLAWLESKAISRVVAAWAGLRFVGRELLELLEDLREKYGAEAVRFAGLEVLMVYHAREIGVVVFPYRRAGRVVHVKCRPPFGKAEAERREVPRFIACGPCPVPFNVDVLEAPPGAEVMICEGETDTLAAVTAGMVAIGSPGKGGFKRAWVPRLRGRRVVVYYDADAAGRDGAASLAKLLEQDGQPPPVPWKTLPEGMDLSDFLAAADPEQDAEALREDFEERAAIMEHDGGLSRAEAEREARVRVYGEGAIP